MDKPTVEPLPLMCDAVLDEAGLQALFADLRACARIEQITVKSGRGHANEPSAISLDTALEMLRVPTIRGIQIRYWFNDTCWIDTLMILGEKTAGVRLVRVQHQGTYSTHEK